MKTNTLILLLVSVAILIGAIYYSYFGGKNLICAPQSLSGQNGNDCVAAPCTCPSCALEATVGYVNKDFGFDVALPDSWKGYTIVTDKWQGYSVADGAGQKLAAEGPQFSIRHPLWTAAVPRQDIPIMVFTLQQWDDMQGDKFHIGAAPINPSELARNDKYVFALPARYNYAFPQGFEEVETILAGSPLHAFGI